MLQRLFDLVAAVSLLLLLAVCVLWVRSYDVADRLDWRGPRGWRMIRTAKGAVVVNILRADWTSSPAEFHGPKYSQGEAKGPINHVYFLTVCTNPGDKFFDREWGRFAWHEKRNNLDDTLHAMGSAPFWYVAMMTAMPPLWWLIISGRHCRLSLRVAGVLSRSEGRH